MTTSVAKSIDGYVNVYADSNPIWIVTLSNNETIYQDDGRPGVTPQSAWERLGIYCEEEGVYITSMSIKNRSHVEVVGTGGDGYYFCKGAGKFLFGDKTNHSFVVGVLENDSLRVRRWNLPEVSPDAYEDRDPGDAGIFLIKRNCNDESLSACDDGTEM